MDERRDGVVGLAYAIRQVAQLLLMCDRHDIGISIDMESATTEIECSTPESKVSTTEATESQGKNFSVNSAISVVGHPSTKSPQIFIYDSYPGGIVGGPLSRAARRAGRHAQTHRGMRLRERMPGLRGAIGDTVTGEDCCAPNPGPVGGADSGRYAWIDMRPRVNTSLSGSRRPPGSARVPRLGSDADPAERWREGGSGHQPPAVSHCRRVGPRPDRRAASNPFSRGRWRQAALPVLRGGSRRGGRRRWIATVGALGDRLPQAATMSVARRVHALRRCLFRSRDNGLSGGAGTYGFLVGCGFDEDGGFVTRQFMLVRLADERALLTSLADELSRAGALVSFNGKSFDAPLVETRCLYHRLAWTGAALPHLDMLHVARRLWKRGDEVAGGAPLPAAWESGCSLGALERQLLGHRRHGDVSGFEIPQRYFQFVRTGDPRPLVPVFEHNRLDLLSLAALRPVRVLRARDRGRTRSTRGSRAGHVYARWIGCSRAPHIFVRPPSPT